jgi:hypothetical protein
MLRGVPVVNEQKAALARLKAEPLGRQLVDGMKTLEELPAEFVDKYNKDLKTLFPDDYLQMMEKEKEVADALQRISGGRGGVGYGPGSKPMFPGGLPIDAQFRGDSPYWSDTNRVFALTREGLRDLTPHFANLGQAIAETTDIIRAGGQKFKSERDIKDVGNVAADALQQAAKDGFLTPWGPMSEFDPWGPGEKKRNLLNLVMGDVNYERLKAAGRIPIRAVTMPGSLIWWMKLWGKSVGAAAAHPTDPGLRAPRPEEELKARIAGIKQAYGTAADIYQHYGSALGAMYFGGKGGGEATRAVANTIGEAIIKGAVYHPPPKPSPESLQAQYGWMSAHKIREERQDFTLSLGADSQDRLAASMTSSLMGSVNRPHRNASVGSGVLMRGSTVARGPAGTGG